MHVHHKIPKHLGGSDDPSNLVLLTIREHAEAHRLLYEQYGHWQDRIAWLGLAGLMSKAEVVREAQRQGGIKAAAEFNPWNEPTKTNFKLNSDLQKKATEAAASLQSNKKRKATMAKNDHQRGSKNSMYGRSWYNDGVKNYCLKPNDDLVKTLVKGRITA